MIGSDICNDFSHFKHAPRWLSIRLSNLTDQLEIYIAYPLLPSQNQLCHFLETPHRLKSSAIIIKIIYEYYIDHMILIPCLCLIYYYNNRYYKIVYAMCIIERHWRFVSERRDLWRYLWNCQVCVCINILVWK